MKDKTIPLIISVVLLIWLMGEILSLTVSNEFGAYTPYIGGAGRLLGLLILITEGQFIKTKFFRFFLLCISIVIIGSLLKIMHWPASEYFLSAGLGGMPLIYVLYFFKKSKKCRLDFLKLTWVLLFYTGIILILFHLPGKMPIRSIESVLFCLMFWDFTLSTKKEKEKGFQWLPDEDQ